MRCSHCSKVGVVEIRMQVGGRDLTFRRCHRCESQSWESPEGPLALVHVLDLARS